MKNNNKDKVSFMRVEHCDSEFLFIKGNPEFLNCTKVHRISDWGRG